MRRVPIAFTLLLACGADTVIVPGEGDEFTDGRTLVQTFVPHRRAPRVDLILVVDDSPSMRPFARRWAENLSAFVDLIESDEVEADIRVAITTTSVPGPTCVGPRARGGEPMSRVVGRTSRTSSARTSTGSSAAASRISQRSAKTRAVSPRSRESRA